MKVYYSKKQKIDIIKSFCAHLDGAPNTSGKFKSFIDVAKTYSTYKR